MRAKDFAAHGDFRTAIAAFEKTLELCPTHYAALCELGVVNLRLGAHAVAEHRFRRAIEVNGADHVAYANLGIALYLQEQAVAAEAPLRQALALKPDLRKVLVVLGRCLYSQGRFVEAEAVLRRALALEPNDTDALYAISITLVSRGQGTEAEVCQERILSIEPNHIGALMLMGDLAGTKGSFQLAEDYYRRALACNPDLAPALGALVAFRKMTAADGPWLESANRLLRLELSKSDECQLRFAVAKYYDDIGDYGQAFENAKRANILAQAISGTPFSGSAFTSSIDNVIRLHDKTRQSRAHVGASISSRPVFVVGMPRTGTSLIEQIVASHPHAFGAGELNYWIDVSAGLANLPGEARFGAETLQSLADGYLQHLSGFGTDAARIVDKMPANFMHCGLIHAAFPNAKFIHAQRHPLDTCLSIYFQKFTPGHAYANDLNDLVQYYRQYCRMIAHWREVLPRDTWLDVPYEGLVADQEQWTRTILRFIGLDWDERCRDFFNTERRVATSSKWQVRQKIYKSSVERWRNYEQFIGPLLALKDLRP